MENITSKVNCFCARYYGWTPSFGMSDDFDWQREKFTSLEEAIHFVDGEEDGEVFINDETIYEDGKFVKNEDEIHFLVKEAESSYIRWLQNELDRMLK